MTGNGRRERVTDILRAILDTQRAMHADGQAMRSEMRAGFGALAERIGAVEASVERFRAAAATLFGQGRGRIEEHEERIARIETTLGLGPIPTKA